MTAGDGFFLSEENILESDFDVIINPPKTFNHHRMESHYMSLSRVYKDNGDESSAKLSFFLSSIFNFSYSRSGDLLGYEPKSILFPERGYRPSDFEKRFKWGLEFVASKTNNPFINSRLHDVIWVNDRRKVESAIISIHSYAEMIDEFAHCVKNKSLEEDCHFFEVMDCLERAFAIASTIAGRKNALDENLAKSSINLYEVMNESSIFNGFYRLSAILYKYNIYSPLLLAGNAERLAGYNATCSYFDAVKQMYEFAGDVYRNIKDRESERRCRVSSVNITLMQAEKSSSKFLAAHWLRQAIGEYRQVGGMQQEINSIKEQLREVRFDTMDEMHTFSTPIDLRDVIGEVIEFYQGVAFPEILKKMMVRFKIPSIEDIRSEVLESSRQSIMMTLAGQSVFDEAGRLIENRPPISPGAGISDDQAKSHYLHSYSIFHQIYINGEFEVVRKLVNEGISINENTFDAITNQSVFVPPGYSRIFSLGFYKLWQGDYISACHILIPQLENSLRWVLEIKSRETTKIDPRKIEEAASISQMLTNLTPELENIFGAEKVLSMDLIFNMKGGPALRHILAHGRLNIHQCHSASTVFACCFIFYLTCYPLYRVWDTDVAPYLE